MFTKKAPNGTNLMHHGFMVIPPVRGAPLHYRGRSFTHKYSLNNNDFSVLLALCLHDPGIESKGEQEEYLSIFSNEACTTSGCRSLLNGPRATEREVI